MNNSSDVSRKVIDINDNRPIIYDEFLLANSDIDTSWLTRSQSIFLKVLMDESNRKKSIADICKTAGYSNTSAWYQALESDKFSRLLMYLGVDLHYISNKIREDIKGSHEIIDTFDISNIETYDTSWMTKMQRKFFEALKCEENRKMTVRGLSKKVLGRSSSNKEWYSALESMRFRNIVRKIGIDIERIEEKYTGKDTFDILKIDSYDSSWMTRSQKILFELLKDENNRTLPIATLLSLGGISDISYYRVRKSERFRKLILNFGVELTTKSHHKSVVKTETLDNLRRIYYDVDPNNLDNLDTTWMNRCQEVFYKVLKDRSNRDKSLNDIVQISGYKSTVPWANATHDEKFRYLLVLMGYAKLFNSKRLRFLSDPNSINYLNLDCLEISWMTNAQEKYYYVLQDKNNINLELKQIVKLAGYASSDTWYKAIRDERFAKLVDSMGFPLKRKGDSHPSHNEVEFIKDPKERESYLKGDIWDVRKLFEIYPLHCKPYAFMVHFTKIINIHLKEIVKKYFRYMLANWKPGTFEDNIRHISLFVNELSELYPSIKTFSELNRDTNIQETLQSMYSRFSSTQVNNSLNVVRGMFKYMYANKWQEGPTTDTLIIDYDIPQYVRSLPKPIPPHLKVILDDYLETIIIPLLAKGEPTPIIEPMIWDMIILLRYTGRRFEDAAHLLADGSESDCLKYDADGDPILFTDHRIAKIPKDIIVPLAHLVDSQGNNIVEQAILRQKNRVRGLGPVTVDGNKYLFRRIKVENRGYAPDTPVFDKDGKPIIEVVEHHAFSDVHLSKVCRHLNLRDENSDIYNITPHQFRHTVATEMIDAGVDIYAVKEFLGHSSVSMTERYIKVYQQKLKKEFKDKLSKSDATDIKNNLPEQESSYNSKWVKNKIIGVLEHGDSCCEHLYKMPSCPHTVCKTCIKKKIYTRHLQSVKDTIESNTIHRDNCLNLGLTDKAEEHDKIVKFYTIALKLIEKGEVFEASKHFYN